MDKQEVIERLNNKLDEVFAFQRSFEPLTGAYMECESKASAYMTAINYVEQLDEPRKVKVPAFVAGWIELCKEKADASSCLNGYYEIGNGTIVRPRGFSEEFYDWLADCGHMDDLARAWLDGYEVEEEPKWIVSIGSNYLTGLQFVKNNNASDVQSFTNGQRKMIFTDKSKAEAVALLVDGSVEEV